MARQAPGVRFASKRFLQEGIVGLGAGLGLGQVWRSGTSSLLVLLGTVVGGAGLMLLLGRLLRINRTLTRLIAVGTAICGASAIGALAPVLVKLTRSVMIVPVCLLFAVRVARERGHGAGTVAGRTPDVPAFIALLLLASALHTIGVLGSLASQMLSGGGQFLIVIALAGVGLSADLQGMRRTGYQPALVHNQAS